MFFAPPQKMDTPSSVPQHYAFGRFRLSADASLLTCDGQALRLAPKVLQTLRVLVQHAGRVVTKRTLLDEVWPGTFVEETGLTRNVSVLRKALDALGEHLIETVPSVGYRFTAPAELVTDHAADDVGVAAPEGNTTPFVGRLAELARLDAALHRADAGRGSVVGLAGDPGIGKSTVAERFVTSAATRRVVGIGRCSELFGTAEPHLPILEAMEAWTASDASTALLARLAPTWLGQVAGRGAGHPAGPQAVSTEHLLRELTRCFTELSRARTVIWFLDDVHWADIGTVDVIAHLAPRLVHMRVLLVLTYRERQLEARQHAFAVVRDALRAKGLLEEITLPLLTRDEVADFVAQAVGSGTEGLDEDIYRRSEGNPLFMAALVGYLGDSGADGPPGGAIPDSLRGLIDRTLLQVSPELRATLDAAAVVGYSFDSPLIAAMSGVDTLTVEDHLEDIARSHGLVVRLSSDASGDREGLTWRFRHALHHARLLEQLAPSRRVLLSRAAADALAAYHGEEDRSIAGTVALLLESARAYPEAASRFAEASHYAARQLALKDAHQLAERGMRCLGRATDLATDVRLRIELALTFAALVPLSSLRGFGHSTVEALVHRASDLAAASDDRVAMARAYSHMVFLRLVRGEGTAARAAAHQLIELAASAEDDTLFVNAHMQAQIACHHLGQFADADHHASMVLRVGRTLRPEQRFISVFDPVVASLAESSRNAWITGRFATAEALAGQAVDAGEAAGNHNSLAFAWLFHAWLHGYKGDWQACADSAARGMSVADAGGTVQTLAWNQCVHGWAQAHLGRPDDGARELEEGIGLSRSIMGEVAMPQFRAMMAEVLRLAGLNDEASRWIREALDASVDHDDAYFSAEIHRLAGACALQADAGTARHHVVRAMELATGQGAVFFQLRAALALHGLTGDAGGVRLALDALAEPLAWPDVVTARLLLHRQTSHQTGAPLE